MTSLLAPASADLTAALHGCLDDLVALDLSGLAGGQQAALLGSLARAEARVAALRLRVLACADRAGVAVGSGAASTGQWAARLSNADPARAQREVGLAQGLERRGVAQRALGSGSISAEHAAVIVQTDQNLPTGVTPAQRETVEAALVEKAKNLTPSGLRRAARRALEAVENDPAVVDAHENELVLSQEDRARAKTRLSIHDNGDGTVSGHFTVPTAQGLLLKKVIDTITAPRRGRFGASRAQAGEPVVRTDWDHARGQALVELIEHLPTEHLHPRSAATLIVTVSEDVLRGALKAAGLDTGEALSAAEVRRLGCTATLVPALLDPQGAPLDLGRSTRFFSERQRLAVALTHRTCAADGCERPFAWCELHHLVPWALGGRSDLANAVPLCHFHHQRIHDHRYEHIRTASGTIQFRMLT